MIEYYWWDNYRNCYPRTFDSSGYAYLEEHFSSYEQALAGASEFAKKYNIEYCEWELKTIFKIQ